MTKIITDNKGVLSNLLKERSKLIQENAKLTLANKKLTEQLTLYGVVSSYVYIITFYDYDHDVIKHTFTDEQTAINKHKELQENRTWGFYNLHKKLIE